VNLACHGSGHLCSLPVAGELLPNWVGKLGIPNLKLVILSLPRVFVSSTRRWYYSVGH